jgi:hypothetical protein
VAEAESPSVIQIFLQLWSASVSADIPVAGTMLQGTLTVDNAFDTGYYDHFSRYKMYALDPGRSVSLRVRVPFGIAD